jgi:hypothetical protein
MNVNDGTNTSLFFKLNKLKANSNADDPLSTAIHVFEFVFFLKCSSNFFTLLIPLPDAQLPLFIVFTAALISLLLKSGENNLIIFISLHYHSLFFKLYLLLLIID